MRALARATEFALYAAVVAVTVGLSIWFIGPSPDPAQAPSHDYLILAAIMAAPWLLGVRALASAWWAGTGARLSTMDPPAVLMAAAVAALPDDRRDWGTAMAAELAGIPDRRARWWFAAGCARTAFFLPRAGRLRVLATASLAAGTLLAAALAVGGAVPEMRVFAVTFAGLVGALALLAAARSGRLRRPAASQGLSAAGLAFVAAGVAGTGYFLVQYPIATRHLTPGMAVLLAAVLAGCLWLTLSPPRALATQQLPIRFAIVAAAGLGAGLLLIARVAAPLGAGIVLFPYLLQVPIVVIFSGSVVAAATRGFRAGVQIAVWTALLTSLAFFAIAVPEAVRGYRETRGLYPFGDTIPPEAVGESLRNAAWALILYPFWWLPFGLVGAGVAHWAERWRARSL